MNPTNVLKQIGQVGLVSKTNNLPKSPRKEKQRALLCESLASLEGMPEQQDCLYVVCFTVAKERLGTYFLLSTHKEYAVHQEFDQVVTV